LNAKPFSDEAIEGMNLYAKANCQNCHNMDRYYDRKLNKTENFQDLISWTSSCDNYFNISWFPDEQKKVAIYLNEMCYKYEATLK
jgi:hypothetical protein